MSKEAIWKYTIDPGPGDYVVSMAMGAVLLMAQPQHGKIAIWAQVDLATASRGLRFQESRIFRVYMTGQYFESTELMKARFIGTCLFESGAYVAHVFELC